ncbi:hypothetical protein FRC01_008582 [Tulasnella sp. 417]|nr:hypothetical protein FRC01_008582 [Tulasnella sp. 417]
MKPAASHTAEEERPFPSDHAGYGLFAFDAPFDSQSPELASGAGPDLDGSDRTNYTSATLSTPYSPSIATPNSYFGSIPAQLSHRHQANMGTPSQAPSTALRTASSRPPFAYLAPLEPTPSISTSPSALSIQPSLSKAETSDACQKGRSIRLEEAGIGTSDKQLYLDSFDQAVGEEDSPYPEVRASVSNTDDPDMPTLTFRMWFIGIILSTIRASFNFFFYLRWPSPWISEALVTVVAYPLGKALDSLLPIRSWTVPLCIPVVGGRSFSLNPGPFNIKEHALISIMSEAAMAPAYGMLMMIATEKDYGFSLGTGFSFLFLLSTEITGFSLAVIARKILVYPASMIWPTVLVQSALLNTLHAEEEKSSGKLSRPNNVVVNQLFGTVTGLGMGLVTFDWTQIGYIASPLVVPWWASVNIFMGFVFFYWVLGPILYYLDVWKIGHLPITGFFAYDRFGLPYDVTRVLTPDMQLNVTAYQDYSPVYLPISFVIAYSLSFMLIPAAIVYTIMYEGRTILDALRGKEVEKEDIHAKLMRHYPEVPNYYFLGLFLTFFPLLIGATKIKDLDVPIWSLFLAILLPTIFFVPFGYVFAKTGTDLGINLIAQLIPGAILPGRPFANMVLKTIAVESVTRSLLFLQNLKLGHYLKIPPRSAFTVQLVASIVAVAAQIAIKNIIFAAVPDLCEPDQPDHLICPGHTTFFSASIIWGLIGPARQFGNGSVYQFQVYALIIGALLPIPFWIWRRRYPRSILNYFNILVFLNGPTFAPPATGIHFTSFFIHAFVFQYLIRIKHQQWWSKYNYVLSSALHAGTGLSVIVIFLALQLPKDGRVSVNWWGNTVWTETADFVGVPYYNTDPEKGF